MKPKKEIHYTIHAEGQAGGPIEDVEDYLRHTLDDMMGVDWEFIKVTEAVED